MNNEYVARKVARLLRVLGPQTVIDPASRLFWHVAKHDGVTPDTYQSHVEAVGIAKARLIERLAMTTQSREIVAACGLSGMMEIEGTDQHSHDYDRP